jgi:hypothetical protein
METEMVDNEFWLKYAKDSITNSLKCRDEGAEKLRSMIFWFWGIYTAVFTIGVSINLIDASLIILILLASPIFVLILSYWFCVYAQLPIIGHNNKTGYDPGIPFEIKQGYNAGLRFKNRHFRAALISTLISALLLGIALVMLSFVNKKQSSSLNVNLNDNKDEILISGLFPKLTLVKTEVDSLVSPNSKITFYQNSFMIQENGTLNLNIPIKKISKSNKIFVTTSWKDNNLEKGLLQIIKN